MNYKEKFTRNNPQLDPRQLELKYNAQLRQIEYERLMRLSLGVATINATQEDDTVNSYVEDDYVEDYFD